MNQPFNDTEEELIHRATENQLRYFQKIDPSCRGLELPDGLILRYNLSETLFFYLRSGLRDGKISTRIFASDSAYDREKAYIGEIITPMFEKSADHEHLLKVERMLKSWVNFVNQTTDDKKTFSSFQVPPRTE